MRIHRMVCRAYKKIAKWLKCEAPLEKLVEELERKLKKIPRRPLRKKKPSTWQMLYANRHWRRPKKNTNSSTGKTAQAKAQDWKPTQAGKQAICALS